VFYTYITIMVMLPAKDGFCKFKKELFIYKEPAYAGRKYYP